MFSMFLLTQMFDTVDQQITPRLINGRALFEALSPHGLPGFWTFVWRVSPLTYCIDGLALASLVNVNITCSHSQFLAMDSPGGVDCTSCLGTYVQLAGGTLSNPLKH
ncbi:hypothetical protein ANO14919_030660 [Xylariales sp. No.14919]|nr:hypothetical protein ANO14919_030660 [Xylariales sp. No.14919]